MNNHYYKYQKFLLIISILLIGFFNIMNSASALNQNINVMLIFETISRFGLDNFAQHINMPSKNLCTGRNVIEERSLISNPDVTDSFSDKCLAILISKYMCYLGDTGSAIKIFEAAKNGCKEREIVALWGGQLAWANGDHAVAFDNWFNRIDGSRYLFYKAIELSEMKDSSFELILKPLLLHYKDGLKDYEIGRGYFILGQLYLDRNDIDLAVNSLENAVLAMPKNVDYLIRLGYYYRLSGQYDRSLNILYTVVSEGIANSYNIGRAYHQLGETYIAVGDFEKADESLSLALKWATSGEEANQQLLDLIKRRLEYIDTITE